MLNYAHRNLPNINNIKSPVTKWQSIQGQIQPGNPTDLTNASINRSSIDSAHQATNAKRQSVEP